MLKSIGARFQKGVICISCCIQRIASLGMQYSYQFGTSQMICHVQSFAISCMADKGNGKGMKIGWNVTTCLRNGWKQWYTDVCAKGCLFHLNTLKFNLELASQSPKFMVTCKINHTKLLNHDNPNISQSHGPAVTSSLSADATTKAMWPAMSHHCRRRHHWSQVVSRNPKTLENHYVLTCSHQLFRLGHFQ